MANNTNHSKKIYSLLRNIPIVGAIFRIVNAYAYQGDIQCGSTIAPFSRWWKRIFRKSFYILLLIELIILYYGSNISEVPWDASDSIFSVFPSVLGFGIGVFALLFIMPDSLMVYMSTNRKKFNFGPEIVPVDIAYPLVIFTVALCWAALSKVFINGFFSTISMFFFFYGLTLAFELISFLFNSSLLIQKISLDEHFKKKLESEKAYRKNRFRR